MSSKKTKAPTKVGKKSADAVFDKDSFEPDPGFAEFLAVMKETDEQVKSHADFSNVVNEMPLGLGEALSDAELKKRRVGYKAAFDADSYAGVFQSTLVFECGGNFFWVDHSKTTHSCVPPNLKGVHMLRDRDFAQPCRYPGVLKIRVPTKKWNPLEHLGAMQSMSPEEVGLAYMMAMSRDHGNPEKMKEWKYHVRTTTCVFELVESEEDCFWRGVSLREDFVSISSAVGRSYSQRTIEIIRVKLTYDTDAKKLGHVEVADKYRNVNMASKSESVTDSFVDNALTFYNRALRFHEVKRAVNKLQAFAGEESIFNSSTRVHGIITAAKYQGDIIWTFQLLTFHFTNGLLEIGGVGVRTLSGPNGTLNQGLVALCVIKNRMREHLSLTFVRENCPHYSDDVVDEVRTRLATPEAYEANYLSPQTDAGSDALKWRAGKPRSALALLDLIEKLVYGIVHDSLLKQALKSRKSPSEILEYDDIAEIVEEIMHHVKAERSEVENAQKKDLVSIDVNLSEQSQPLGTQPLELGNVKKDNTDDDGSKNEIDEKAKVKEHHLLEAWMKQMKEDGYT